MTKSEIKRGDVADPCLKQIIIRLDYAGVSDVIDLVKLFDKRFPKDFKSKNEVYNRNYAIRQEDLREISESLSVPVRVIQDERIIRYSEMKGVKAKATLDLSRYYICMTIDIDGEYEGLGSYETTIKGAITLFKDNINYFSPRRLGLRKIRVEKFKTIEESNHTFEPFVYTRPNFELNQPIVNKAVYYDHLTDRDNEHLRYNVRREYDLSEAPEGNPMYLFTLDIDTYFNDIKILGKKGTNDLLSLANEQEFNIYKACMTLDYLKTHPNNKK